MSDDMLFARVAAQFFGTPLLIRQREADIVGGYLLSRMAGPGPDSNRFTGKDEFDPATRRWKGYRKEGSVAIVSILGELVNRGAWMGASSSLTSYEGIAQQLRNAAADKDVKSIILDINSPGGEALGMAETARLIRSVASSKRVVAVANAMAASAAFGLASGASEIVATESSILGSIGVVLVHFDRSRQFDKAGIAATIVKAGDEKAVGNPYIALSDEDRAVLQAEVDRVMTGFIRVVTDHRPKLTAKTIKDLQAGIRIGEDAVRAGLADRVGTFEGVLTELSHAYPAQTKQRSSTGTALMTKAERFRSIHRDSRLVGSPFLRDIALQAAERAPASKAPDEIVTETLAAFSNELSPAERDDLTAHIAARTAPQPTPEADPLAIHSQTGGTPTNSWSTILKSMPEAPGEVKSGGPFPTHSSIILE